MMNLRNVSIVLLAVSMFFGGCIFDGDDDDDKDNGNVSGIEELSIGGYVFILSEQGFGLAQVITLHGEEPYEDAEVFVNGIALGNIYGVHTNVEQLPLDRLTAEPTVRIAVYALGDSVTSDLKIPETPVIGEPAEGAIQDINANLKLSIGYPGDHDYIAFSILGQEVPHWGEESDKTSITAEISSSYLTKIGTYQLNAYSVNASKKIPEGGIDLTNPQNIFVVAAVAIRNIKFVGPD